jgi:hypothetical protein
MKFSGLGSYINRQVNNATRRQTVTSDSTTMELQDNDTPQWGTVESITGATAQVRLFNGQIVQAVVGSRWVTESEDVIVFGSRIF